MICECEFESMLRIQRRRAKKRGRERSHQTNFNPLTEIVRLCRAVPRSHPVGADSRPAPHAAERLIDRRAAARSPHEQGEAGARGEHGCWGGEGSTREGKETASFFHLLTRSLARAKKRKMKKKLPSGHFGFLPYFFSFDPVDDPDDPPPKKKSKMARPVAPAALPAPSPAAETARGGRIWRVAAAVASGFFHATEGGGGAPSEAPLCPSSRAPSSAIAAAFFAADAADYPDFVDEVREGEREEERKRKKRSAFFSSRQRGSYFFFHLPLPS